MEATLIAPCGMNCGICKSHLRRYKACPGCNNNPTKLEACFFHNCQTLQANKSGFCFECGRFPCKKLEQLDTKHKNHDGLSMIDNLKYISEYGMQDFLKAESVKWKCPECGGLVCVGAHEILCSACGYVIQRLGFITKKGR